MWVAEYRASQLRSTPRFVRLTHFAELSDELERARWIWFCHTTECLEWYGRFGRDFYTISLERTRLPALVDLGDPTSWEPWMRALRWESGARMGERMLPTTAEYDTSELCYLVVPRDDFAFRYDDARFIAEHYFTEFAPTGSQIERAKQMQRWRVLHRHEAEAHLRARDTLVRDWIDTEALAVMDTLHTQNNELGGWQYAPDSVLGMATVLECEGGGFVSILFFHLPEWLLSKKTVGRARYASTGYKD